MTGSTIERLTEAYQNNEDAIFSLFTLAGHVVSGRITAISNSVTLTAGKEVADVPVDRIEAFCYRKL